MSVRQPQGENLLVDTGLPSLKGDISNTIQKLRSSGKQVIVIASPPGITTQNLNCMERTLSGKVSFGDNLDCGKPRSVFERYSKNLDQFYSFLEQDLHVRVVRLSDTLCNTSSCASIVDGVPIYRDEGHLSVVGSMKIYQLAQRVIN